MRTISEKTLVKTKAVDSEGKEVLPFKYEREAEKTSPEDKQTQALQNIAEMIKQGLSQKTDYDKLIDSVGQAITALLKQNSENMEKAIKDIGNNIKIKAPKPVTRLNVYEIERNHRGTMTGFKMRAIR